MIKLIGKPLYQWDTGREVSITPADGVVIHEVHFANDGDKLAIPMPVEDLTAKIPDVLLQTGRAVISYAVTVSDDGESTLAQRCFPVREKPKPEDYVYTEAEKALSELKVAIAKAENAAALVGCYYIPEVTQDDTTSMRVSFTASKEGMPAVEDQVVELPAGPAGKTPVKGEDYFTDADREELVTAVLAALPDGDEVEY